MEVGASGSSSHPVHLGTRGGSEFVYKPLLTGTKAGVYMGRVTQVVGFLGSRDRVTRPPE